MDIQKNILIQQEIEKSIAKSVLGADDDLIQKAIDAEIEKGGKHGSLGERRIWNGKEYHKTDKGWRPVPKGDKKETVKKISDEEADDLLSSLRENDVFQHDVLGHWEDHFRDSMDEDDATDAAVDKVLELIKKDPESFKQKYLNSKKESSKANDEENGDAPEMKQDNPKEDKWSTPGEIQRFIKNGGRVSYKGKEIYSVQSFSGVAFIWYKGNNSQKSDLSISLGDEFLKESTNFKIFDEKKEDKKEEPKKDEVNSQFDWDKDHKYQAEEFKSGVTARTYWMDLDNVKKYKEAHKGEKFNILVNNIDGHYQDSKKDEELSNTENTKEEEYTTVNSINTRIDKIHRLMQNATFREYPALQREKMELLGKREGLEREEENQATSKRIELLKNNPLSPEDMKLVASWKNLSMFNLETLKTKKLKEHVKDLIQVEIDYRKQLEQANQANKPKSKGWKTSGKGWRS